MLSKQHLLVLLVSATLFQIVMASVCTCVCGDINSDQNYIAERSLPDCDSCNIDSCHSNFPECRLFTRIFPFCSASEELLSWNETLRPDPSSSKSCNASLLVTATSQSSECCCPDGIVHIDSEGSLLRLNGSFACGNSNQSSLINEIHPIGQHGSSYLLQLSFENVPLTLIRKHDRVLGFHGKCRWDLRPVQLISDDQGFPGWAAALIIIGVLSTVVIVSFLGWYVLKKHRETLESRPLIGAEEFIN